MTLGYGSAGFMVQGGDPTATGEGGESIYGSPFKDEYHSRLRFTHRGLVACANQNKPDTNGSQFFVTLDRCEDLNKRYTIFGRVAGDTVFNVARIGDVLTDKDNRPVDPVVLQSTEVIWNPFEDIIPRRIEPKEESPADNAPNKTVPKGKKDLRLLSFGDEAEDDEAEIANAPATKIVSAHDALERDAKLIVTNTAEALELKAKEDAELEANINRVRTVLQKGDGDSNLDPTGSGDAEVQSDKDPVGLTAKMHARVAAMREKQSIRGGSLSEHDEPALETAPAQELSDDMDEATVERDRLHLKRKSLKAETVKDADLLTKSQIQRAKLKRRKQLHGNRERDTLSRLEAFKSTFKSLKTVAPRNLPSSGEKSEPDEDGVEQNTETRMDIPTAWRIDDYLHEEGQVQLAELTSHRLEFKGADKNDDMNRRDDVNDYVVFDPLLEEGKSKFNKKQQEAKRKNRQWTQEKHLPDKSKT